MKKLPIGLSDFRTMIEGNFYYVDKSLLIQEMIDSGSTSILLPRPRRFGKTLNLSMLRYFFEATNTDTSRLFRHLNIWRLGENYTRHQGKYPVIYLTFKDVKSRNWEQCREHLFRVVSQEYARHEAALSNGKLSIREKEEYRRILHLTASQAAFEDSLRMLSSLLYEHYGHKAVILIDEYDTPIQEGYVQGYYQEVIGFIRNLLSGALKDNPCLEKGVLTGILRVAKESIFSGLNNLEVGSILNERYSGQFGLKESETVELLQHYGIESAHNEIRTWYNGYIFGKTVIYNPWSILNYVHNRTDGFRTYWVNTSSNDLIRSLVTRGGGEVKKDLERLIQGGSIRKEINDNIVFPEIERNPDALWSFLLFSGYLTAVSTELDKRLYGELKIPNKEVEVLYEDIIFNWFRTSIQGEHLRMMLESLVTGETDTFEEIFRDYVASSFSMFDTGGDTPEKVYHAFVLGLLVGLQDTYEVRSNRESGYGRYDVMLIPKGDRRDSKHKGVIMEFKKKRDNETLAEAAAAALRQVTEKEYIRGLRERGFQDVIQLGIAFEGKQVRIKTIKTQN